MATKKSATSAKKPVKKTAASSTKKATVTKVATVKSVAAPAAASPTFSFTRSPLLSASIAEFVGAFALAGVVLATQGASIYVMFTLVALTLAIGMISGAHFNPALTVGAWATKRIKSARALSYIVAQVLGALLALVLLDAFVKAGGQAGGAQGLQIGQQATELFKASALPGGKEWLILVAELIGAMLFAFGFSAAAKEKSRSAGAWVVGGSLFVALTVSSFMTLAVTTAAAQSTGASPLSTVLNPAIAGALQAISFTSIWPVLVYAVAPIVGATLGFALRDLLVVEAESEV